MDKMIIAWCAVLALLLLANMAVSIWQGRQEKKLRMAMERWESSAIDFMDSADRMAHDIPPVLEKLEDMTAQQLQDWNEIQREFAVLDGRLGQVERRFDPLAPLEQKVDAEPETEADEPKPVEEELHD